MRTIKISISKSDFANEVTLFSINCEVGYSIVNSRLPIFFSYHSFRNIKGHGKLMFKNKIKLPAWVGFEPKNSA